MNVYIKENIIQDLISDRNIRMELAVAVNLTERAIWLTANRALSNPTANSSLTKLSVILFYRQRGLKDDAIFYIK